MGFIIYPMTTAVTGMNFASAILADKDVTVKPVSSAEYPQKAWRPRHSILDLSKTKATGFKIETWQDALKEFLQVIEK